MEPTVVDVVKGADGVPLMVAEWSGPGPTVVFVPGLASTHRSASALAQALAGRARVVAFDPRGRGSSGVPAAGGYGMERHGEDLIAVMDALGLDNVFASGHSMGAYAATAAVARAQHRFAGLVLVDGGTPIPPPADASPVEAEIAAQVSGFMEVLQRRYPSVDAYLDFWRTSPFYGGEWSDAIESKLRYDLGFSPDGYVVRVSPDAVMQDWAECEEPTAIEERLRGIRIPVLLVAADSGFVPASPPLSDEWGVARLQMLVPHTQVAVVESTTHHTLVLGRAGARATAAAVADFCDRCSQSVTA